MQPTTLSTCDLQFEYSSLCSVFQFGIDLFCFTIMFSIIDDLFSPIKLYFFKTFSFFFLRQLSPVNDSLQE